MPVRKSVKAVSKELGVELKSEKTISAQAFQEGSSADEILKNLADLKLRLGQSLEKIGQNLLDDLDGLRSFKISIEQQKQKINDRFLEEQAKMEKEIRELKLQFEEEKKKLDMIRKRDEEEYQYQLSLKHREQEDEINNQRQLREEALEQEEEALRQRKAEIGQMEKEIANLPQTMEKTVKEAEEKVSKELHEKHTLEMERFELDKNNEQNINRLKINNLETNAKAQILEIENLKRQLAEANRQLKDIAVSVITSRGSNAMDMENK